MTGQKHNEHERELRKLKKD